jgi:hypothetical protein
MKRLPRFLWRWITVVIPVAVIALTAASGVSHGHYKLAGRRLPASWTLIVIAAALALVEAVLVGRRQRRIDTLDSQRAEFARRAALAERALMLLLRAELIALQERARLYSSERVSLFRCDGDSFTLVARRSSMPVYDESLGRGRYPLDAGVLGQAWERNSAGVESLPPAGTDTIPKRRWLDAQSKLKIPEAVACDLKMRSQSYAGFRIVQRERSLGVIVFESVISVSEATLGGGTSPTKRTVAEIEPLVKEASARLAELLEASASLTPETIRNLLDEQQGPASRKTHAAASASARSSA